MHVREIEQCVCVIDVHFPFPRVTCEAHSIIHGEVFEDLELHSLCQVAFSFSFISHSVKKALLEVRLPLVQSEKENTLPEWERRLQSPSKVLSRRSKSDQAQKILTLRYSLSPPAWGMALPSSA